jgi:formate hydrogenlyase subunit 6/NADH:ubiquinone oxidoreductase subunit I
MSFILRFSFSFNFIQTTPYPSLTLSPRSSIVFIAAPYGRGYRKELPHLKKAFIVKNKCDQSPFCPVKRVCPTGAVTQKRKFLKAEHPVIDAALCIGCKKCVAVCPHGAVAMK